MKSFIPFIRPEDTLPQITVKAVILGFLLSAVMAGANAYLGLKVGLTVSASIPAAVISMAILKLFRRSNILENNIVQTSASAGESLAAGAIFTLPALVLLGYWQGFPFWLTTCICVTGGILGVLFTIPLRRTLIIENNLTFPEGMATSEVLKVGSEGGKGVKSIAIAGVLAAFFKFGQTGFKIFSGGIHKATAIGGGLFGFSMDLSPALLGVGYIIGFRIALVVFSGGIISWAFGIPLYSMFADAQTLNAITGGEWNYSGAIQIWSKKIRYLGVGAMVVGGLWALISLLKPLIVSIKASFEAWQKSRVNKGVAILRTEKDMPIHFVMYGTLLLAIPIFVIFLYVVDTEIIPISTMQYYTIAIVGVFFSVIVGFLFSSVAGYMAGLVGSSNNPISGVTIATVLSASFILLLLFGSALDVNVGDQSKIAAGIAILIGSVVCCAAAIAGDNMQDLKAGYLLGSTPYKQQIMQMVGVMAAALVVAPIMSLLLQAYGIGDYFPRSGMDPTAVLSAPQASLMQAVAEGVFTQNLEWTMFFIGGGISLIVIIIDNVLKKNGSSWRIPVLAVAVGIYLPLGLTSTLFLGGLVAHWIKKQSQKREYLAENYQKIQRNGVLISSGMITGEALAGIFLAIPFALFQSTNVLSIVGEGFSIFANILGVVGMAGFIYLLVRGLNKKE